MDQDRKTRIFAPTDNARFEELLVLSMSEARGREYRGRFAAA
jgi:hypothetical protein